MTAHIRWSCGGSFIPGAQMTFMTVSSGDEYKGVSSARSGGSKAAATSSGLLSARARRSRTAPDGWDSLSARRHSPMRSSIANISTPDSNTCFLDRVVAVPQPVPATTVRLNPAGEVGGPGPNAPHTGLLETGGELPPLPAVAVAIADQRRLLTLPTVDADIHPGDGCRTRPRDTADSDVSPVHGLVGSGFDDERAHVLESDRLAVHVVLVDLEVPIEGLAGHLDMG